MGVRVELKNLFWGSMFGILRPAKWWQTMIPRKGCFYLASHEWLILYISWRLSIQHLYLNPYLTTIFCPENVGSLGYLRTKANELRYQISNNMVCATSKGSDQPAHTHSLIRAFASCLNSLWLLGIDRHNLEFLSSKGGSTVSSESILVKMPHCWKSYARLKRGSRQHKLWLVEI